MCTPPNSTAGKPTTTVVKLSIAGGLVATCHGAAPTVIALAAGHLVNQIHQVPSGHLPAAVVWAAVWLVGAFLAERLCTTITTTITDLGTVRYQHRIDQHRLAIPDGDLTKDDRTQLVYELTRGKLAAADLTTMRFAAIRRLTMLMIAVVFVTWHHLTAGLLLILAGEFCYGWNEFALDGMRTSALSGPNWATAQMSCAILRLTQHMPMRAGFWVWAPG